jgi:hypothetical protein
MSQPAGPPTVVPTPDETIMKRLTYIRLLYRQAVAQSYATPPLNFSTVLAFHDVLELFFIVAVNHLGNPQGINLKAPFADNIRKFRAPDGNQLSSVDAVQRIGHDRNGFKHNGSIPGPDQVEQTRRDATRFLEGNCPRLFGIEFGDISMLHIVPQDAVRDHLLAGRAAANTGEIKTAMAEVALAFDRLIMDWGNEKYVPGSSFLTETLHFDAHRYRSHRRIDVSPCPSDPATESLILSVTKAFEDVDKQLETMRRVLRIQIAGVDTASYIRFAMITPEIEISADGHRYPVDKTGQLYYTRENYDLCEMFVVNSALQIGQNDFKLWMPKTYGDIDRAIEAMAANGGRLPDNM